MDIDLTAAEIEQVLPGLEQVIAEHVKDIRFFDAALTVEADRDTVVGQLRESLTIAKNARRKLRRNLERYRRLTKES